LRLFSHALAGARCLLIIVSAVQPAAAGQAPASLSLSDALARAASANRTILASNLARPIDLAGIRASAQRPNPEVSVEAERETPHWAFGAGLPIELAGKRQRRIDVAQATLAVTDAETARIVAGVRSDVRRAYFLAVAAVRRGGIAQDLEGIAGRARDAAQERFQTGAAPRLEALQAQLALAQAQNDAAAAQADVTAARAELNVLLAYQPDASPALTDALDLGTLPSAADATAAAVAGNAELQVLVRQIESDRARVALAQAMRHPDPTVSASLVYDSEPEFTFGWRLGAAVALPLFTTGRADVAVADATLNRTIAQRDARTAQIGAEVAAALARAEGARQALLRYQNEIVPASQQVEQMAQESYQSGQTGLLALLQTLQSTRDIRLRAVQAGLDYQTALADLERAMGTPLK
jgi:cobalt-zinc-cadmium efflux system outer membrane protein